MKTDDFKASLARQKGNMQKERKNVSAAYFIELEIYKDCK